MELADGTRLASRKKIEQPQIQARIVSKVIKLRQGNEENVPLSRETLRLTLVVLSD